MVNKCSFICSVYHSRPYTGLVNIILFSLPFVPSNIVLSLSEAVLYFLVDGHCPANVSVADWSCRSFFSFIGFPLLYVFNFVLNSLFSSLIVLINHVLLLLWITLLIVHACITFCTTSLRSSPALFEKRNIFLAVFFFFLFNLQEFILHSVINKWKFLVCGKDFFIAVGAVTRHRLSLLDLTCRGKLFPLD